MLIFLKSCRLRQPGAGVAVPVEERCAGPIRTRRRHGDVVVFVDAELLVQRRARSLLCHQLVEIGPRPEVIADPPNDEDLDVVIDAGLEDQVRVAPAGRNGRDVQLVGAVQRDGGDAGLGILVVEDDLLRRRDIGFGHVRLLLVSRNGVLESGSGPVAVTTTGSWA